MDSEIKIDVIRIVKRLIRSGAPDWFILKVVEKTHQEEINKLREEIRIQREESSFIFLDKEMELRYNEYRKKSLVESVIFTLAQKGYNYNKEVERGLNQIEDEEKIPQLHFCIDNYVVNPRPESRKTIEEMIGIRVDDEQLFTPKPNLKKGDGKMSYMEKIEHYKIKMTEFENISPFEIHYGLYIRSYLEKDHNKLSKEERLYLM